MSNQLSVLNNLPEHLKSYTSEQHRQDFGSLKPSDYGINMMKMCQGQSKEARPGHNGEPALPLGSMFLAQNRQVIQPGTLFIPLLRTNRYIKWNGRPGEGRMEFSTDNANDPRIVACNGLAWIQDERTGKNLKPLVTEYVNFYVMLQGQYEEPVLLSFSRTGMKNARSLTQNTARATAFGKLPLRALAYKLGAPLIDRDASNEWYQFNVVPAGFAPAEVKDHADRLYLLACALRDASTGAELANIDTDADEEPPITAAKPVQPSTVTVAAPTMPAATATPPAVNSTTVQPAQPPVQPVQKQQQTLAKPEVNAPW